MPYLVIMNGNRRGQTYEVRGAITSIGRSPANSICLEDQRMSRHHAEILHRGPHYYIRDLDSRNGTTVNSTRVYSETPLGPGDELFLGETRFKVYAELPQLSATDTADLDIALLEDMEEEDGIVDNYSSSWGEMTAFDAEEIDLTQSIGIADDEPSDIDLRQQMETFSQIISAMRSILDLDDLLKTTIDLIFEMFQPDRGVVLLRDNDSGALVSRLSRSNKELENIPTSQTLINKCVTQRVALLASNLQLEEDPKPGRVFRTAMCAPLLFQQDTIGVLYIDTAKQNARYQKGDLDLLYNIAGIAAVSVANARMHNRMVEQAKIKHELDIASKIQMMLICREVPQPAGFDIAAMTMPAQEVGGDFYDFVEVDDEKVVFAVADVSGKGIPAAIMASSIRSALQVMVRENRRNLPEMLEDLNEMTRRDSLDAMYATMVVGSLDIRRRMLRYSIAGHHPPMLFLPGEKGRALEAGGPIIGIVRSAQWTDETVYFPEGAVLALFSDGALDVRDENNELLGVESLVETIEANRDAPARHILEQIYEMTGNFRGNTEQYDDLTLMVIKSTSR